MLSKITSFFLFMITVNGCFLLFFYNNQTHRTTKPAKYVNKIIVLKLTIKI